MNILKLATCFAIAIVIGGSAITARADSILVINNGPGVTAIFTTPDSPTGVVEATLSLAGNKLKLKLTNLADASGMTQFAFDSISNATLQNDGVAVLDLAAVFRGHSELLARNETTTLTFSLGDFTGNLGIGFRRVQFLNLPNEGKGKPVSCYGCLSTIPNPEPASLALLGSGLIGITTLVRRQLKKSQLRS